MSPVARRVVSIVRRRVRGSERAVVAKEQLGAPRPEAEEAGRECISTDASDGSSDKECKAAPSTSVYVVGDIHG
ncbi:hypothetical protein THAOC_02165, partial [Thalassiosira oceanica]